MLSASKQIVYSLFTGSSVVSVDKKIISCYIDITHKEVVVMVNAVSRGLMRTAVGYRSERNKVSNLSA